eukprot:Em0598g6a
MVCGSREAKFWTCTITTIIITTITTIITITIIIITIILPIPNQYIMMKVCHKRPNLHVHKKSTRHTSGHCRDVRRHSRSWRKPLQPSLRVLCSVHEEREFWGQENTGVHVALCTDVCMPVWWQGSGDLPEFHFGSEQDKLYEGRCRALRKKLVPEALGVPDDYHCPFPATIALLNAIDTLPSPLEKLYCIQDAMATILVQCTLAHIPSTTYYLLQYFYWPASDSDRLGYVLVTFIAAMEYIRGPEVQSFLPPPQSQAPATSSKTLNASGHTASTSTSGGFASGRLSSEASSEQPRKIVPMTESVSKTSHSSDLGLSTRMAKGIRSKRRQRVLAVRRQKYRELGVKKCWEHQTRRANEAAMTQESSMEDTNVASTEDGTNTAMDSADNQQTLSKTAIEKLRKKYMTKNKSRKPKRLITKW